MALYNCKVPVITKKNNFILCPGKLRKNFINIFPGLFRTNKQNSRTFQDSKKNQGLSRTFPGCGNPERRKKKKHSLSTFSMILSKKNNHISTTENIMKTQKLTLSCSYKHRTLHNEKHDGPIVTIFNSQIYVVITLTSSSRQLISFFI